MPCPLGIDLRPEESDQLVPGQARFAGDGKHREQRDCPALRGRATHRFTRRVSDDGGAEGL
jgi:hypothetical protein